VTAVISKPFTVGDLQPGARKNFKRVFGGRGLKNRIA